MQQATLTLVPFYFSMWFAVPACFIFGMGFGFFFYRAYTLLLRKGAEFEAELILEKVRDEDEIRQLEQKERTQEIETELWTKEESKLLSLEEKIEELEEISTERKHKADDKYSQLRQKFLSFETEIKAEEAKLKQRDEKLQGTRDQNTQLNEKYINGLLGKLQLTRDNVKEEIIQSLVTETQKYAAARAQFLEEETKEHSELRAKEILDRIFQRFQRPAPTERGIAPVYFEEDTTKEAFFKLDPSIGKAVQEQCGCDIVIDRNLEMVGVAGFDPVRRELTRRVLERILKELRLGPKHQVSPDWVAKVAGNIKTEILRMIKHDGDLIAKDLKIDKLHPEIRQVMGSLRYRYSFTQNQYFHCGEVGFLCGLLAGELGSGRNRRIDLTDDRKARRAGMLHDLGKAMDHQLEGGHAVIGADFIAARGEAPDIVHAVRSHHYDEQPNTDLAYLVIAADAISGARPGARRSTVETYTQKITELQDIARSFPGVTDCFILSGGRECRVHVNSKKVDDLTALKMSSEIAHRIENECNYPGQIKVVVIRESHAAEQTLRG
jgi:ribonuclease Y